MNFIAALLIGVAIGVVSAADIKALWAKARGTYVDPDSPVVKITRVRGLIPIPPEYVNPDGTIKYPPSA